MDSESDIFFKIRDCGSAFSDDFPFVVFRNIKLKLASFDRNMEITRKQLL